MKRWILALLMVVTVACDDTRGMDTRTYQLSRLTADQAQALITPYVRSGGTIAYKDKLITVRERPDRLKVIEDLLKKYDLGADAVDVMLHIDAVQADGFTERDTTLAQIEPLLRQTFRYTGFRSLGQTVVRVREEGEFRQSQEPNFNVSGHVSRIEKVGNEMRLPLEIRLTITRNDRTGLSYGAEMASMVTATIGKPMVLGKSMQKGAIILIITPTLASM